MTRFIVQHRANNSGKNMRRLKLLVTLGIVMAVCPVTNGYVPSTVLPTSSTKSSATTKASSSTAAPGATTTKPSSSTAAPGATTTRSPSSSTAAPGTTSATTTGGSGGTTTSGNSCTRSKYRSIDASCSNPSNPLWGKAGQPYGRMLPPNYADGISSPPVMANGMEYASARSVSFNVFFLDETSDPSNTLLNLFFLTALGNDLSLPAGSTNPQKCCKDGQLTGDTSQECYPVEIPNTDPIYSWYKITCLNYVRTLTVSDQPGQPVRQINDASSQLDLSFLYGTSVEQSNNLRTLVGGRLKATRRNGVEWPVINPAGCDWADVCYLVADPRSYQFPMSATVHLLFLREHNRLANQLKLVNTLWTDEQLFQEARRINVAQYQSIAYYEYLPRLLGRDNMLSSGLIYDSTGFTTDYNRFQDPAAVAEFTGVVVPFMQSQLPGSINFYTNDTIQSARLSSLAGSLVNFEATFDAFFAGLIRQSTRLVDTSFSIEWKNFMYSGSSSIGQDLLALDIQRMRDFGFARYNDYRLRCGLGRFATWEAYNATQRAPCAITMQRMQAIYSTVDDLDLFVGAAFENPLPGSLLGPTFSCLVRQQFLALRTGDRYFFEAGGQDGSFTAAQLTEIRKVKLSKLMCNAFPTTPAIQADVLSPVTDANPLVACTSLPGLNTNLFV